MSDTSDDVAKAGLGVVVKALEKSRLCGSEVMRGDWELSRDDVEALEWSERHPLCLMSHEQIVAFLVKKREDDKRRNAEYAAEWHATQERLAAERERERRMDERSAITGWRFLLGALAFLGALVAFFNPFLMGYVLVIWAACVYVAVVKWFDCRSVDEAYAKADARLRAAMARSDELWNRQEAARQAEQAERDAFEAGQLAWQNREKDLWERRRLQRLASGQ